MKNTKEVLEQISFYGPFEYFVERADRHDELKSEKLSKYERAELHVMYENCTKYADTLNTYVNGLLDLLQKDMLQ